MNNFIQMKRLAVIAGLFFLSAFITKAQTPLYDLNVIQRIEVYFSAANWDYQLDSAKAGIDDYVIADWGKN